MPLIGLLLLVFSIVTYPASIRANPCTSTQPAMVSNSYFDGSRLNDLNERELSIYAIGFVEAYVSATLIGVSEQCRQALQTCVVRRNSRQLAAMKIS